MSLILSGTDGLSDVDGSAATPAIRGTDANTGIFFGTDIIGFSEGGVEAMRINASGNLQTIATIGVGNATPSTSGAGITFPVTQSASTNAKTLDDYEEGTWTATMVPSTSGTITLSNNGGTYTKIGRTVTINAVLKVSSVSSPVGYFTIQGLPFSGGAGATFRCSISIFGDAMETTMTTSITASMQSGTILYVFKYNGTGSQANCAQDVKTNSEFFIGGTYLTD